jgi:uncharacterized membrane protein YfcA
MAFIAVGAVTGVFAGLLGIGGGLLIVLALAWLLPLLGVPAAMVMHAALATSLASIVVTSLSSSCAHHRRGAVLWPTVAWMVPGLLLGGWLGSRVAVHVPGAWLRWGVALYCAVMAWQLLRGRHADGADGRRAPTGAWLSLAGAGIGGVSALIGIGGGSMTVPLLIARRVAPVRAVATSSACGAAIGLGSALGYALDLPGGGLPLAHSWGYVYLPATAGIALAAALTAPLGTRLAHRLPAARLRAIFAVFLLVLGTALLAGA